MLMLNTKDFADDLMAMAQRDLDLREDLLSQNALSDGYHPAMEAVHRRNAENLRGIIAQIGFPTISRVGVEAHRATWLIVQHSIGEPDFMVKCYKLMKADEHDVLPERLAFLEDRIAFFRGLPQRFGTQKNADGTIYPVEDRAQLNSWREAFNLPLLTPEALHSIPPITEIAKQEAAMPGYIEWREKAGWNNVKL